MSVAKARQRAAGRAQGRGGAGGRARPGYPEALTLALKDVQPLPAERVPVRECLGRVLRQALVADRDLPPFDRATMDGFALRRAEIVLGVPVPVAGQIHAGGRFTRQVRRGTCVAIATGAAVPNGLDTVVEHERTLPGPTIPSGGGSSGTPTVVFRSLPSAGASIHRRGVDAARRTALVAEGVALSPELLGIAAAVGAARPAVSRRPRVAILTSGGEIVPPHSRPRREQVRNSNAPMLEALVAVLGGEVVGVEHLPDEPSLARSGLASAVEHSDVVVTVGGISAGQRDPFVALLHDPKATVLLRGASIQPGGPITVARWARRRGGASRAGAPRGAARDAILVGLPGNPVSALVCGHLFLCPIMRLLLGQTDPMPWGEVRLGEAVRPNPSRTAFRPSRLTNAQQRGTAPTAMVARWSGSGDLVSTAGTDGVVEIPPGTCPVPKGVLVRFLPWAWRRT